MNLHLYHTGMFLKNTETFTGAVLPTEILLQFLAKIQLNNYDREYAGLFFKFKTRRFWIMDVQWTYIVKIRRQSLQLKFMLVQSQHKGSKNTLNLLSLSTWDS
jgi:hypothetical protein